MQTLTLVLEVVGGALIVFGALMLWAVRDRRRRRFDGLGRDRLGVALHDAEAGEIVAVQLARPAVDVVAASSYCSCVEPRTTAIGTVCTRCHLPLSPRALLARASTAAHAAAHDGRR